MPNIYLQVIDEIVENPSVKRVRLRLCVARGMLQVNTWA